MAIALEFNVLVEIDIKTGIQTMERWERDGRLSREFAPALREWNGRTGICVREAWYQAGLLMRDDEGPCEIRRDYATGEVYMEAYASGGGLHSTDDKPAVWWKCVEDNAVLTEEWYRYGKRHRDGGRPAIVERLPTGEIREESFYENGELIRTETYIAPESLEP